MAATRKTYTAEFKLQAVRMVTDQHLGFAEAARRLGVSESRLHEWLKAFRTQGSGAFPCHGRLSPQDEELHRLRVKVQRLKAERDILKKAAAYFASHLTCRSPSSSITASSGRSPGCATPWRSRPLAFTTGSGDPTARPDGDDDNWYPP